MIYIRIVLFFIALNWLSLGLFPLLGGSINTILAVISMLFLCSVVGTGILKSLQRGSVNFQLELKQIIGWFIYILFIVLNYGFIYSYLGLAQSASCALLNNAVKCHITHSIFIAIYFSVISFTTVGYGDFIPPDNSVRVLAAFEAFSGYILLGLIVARLISLFSASSKTN